MILGIILRYGGGGGIDESRLGEMILVGLYCFVDGKD